MKFNQAIQSAPQQFADHIEQIILRNIPLKEDFRQRMGMASLSEARLTLMESFASANLAESLHDKLEINWWHVFTDPFKQTLLPLKMDVPDLQQDSLAAIIIFTNWNIQNFKLICNIETGITSPPAYPAQREDIAATPMLLSYLEKEMLPVMKGHLRATLNIPLSEMEGQLAQKAVLYELEHTPGVETLAPISSSEWNASPSF